MNMFGLIIASQVGFYGRPVKNGLNEVIFEELSVFGCFKSVTQRPFKVAGLRIPAVINKSKHRLAGFFSRPQRLFVGVIDLAVEQLAGLEKLLVDFFLRGWLVLGLGGQAKHQADEANDCFWIHGMAPN